MYSYTYIFYNKSPSVLVVVAAAAGVRSFGLMRAFSSSMGNRFLCSSVSSLFRMGGSGRRGRWIGALRNRDSWGAIFGILHQCRSLFMSFVTTVSKPMKQLNHFFFMAENAHNLYVLHTLHFFPCASEYVQMHCIKRVKSFFFKIFVFKLHY